MSRTVPMGGRWYAFSLSPDHVLFDSGEMPVNFLVPVDVPAESYPEEVV